METLNVLKRNIKLPEGLKRLTGFGKFLVASGVSGVVLAVPVAGRFEATAQDSNQKALNMQYDDPAGPAHARETQAFIDQNDHTKTLGDWEHYSRLAGGALLLITVSAAASAEFGHKKPDDLYHIPNTEAVEA